MCCASPVTMHFGWLLLCAQHNYNWNLEMWWIRCHTGSQLRSYQGGGTNHHGKGLQCHREKHTPCDILERSKRKGESLKGENVGGVSQNGWGWQGALGPSVPLCPSRSTECRVPLTSTWLWDTSQHGTLQPVGSLHHCCSTRTVKQVFFCSDSIDTWNILFSSKTGLGFFHMPSQIIHPFLHPCCSHCCSQ